MTIAAMPGLEAKPDNPLLDDIAALLAAAPPRRPSPALRRAALRRAAPLSLALFGAVFALFGLVFSIVFFPWNLHRDLRLSGSDAVEAAGVIDSAEEAGMSINDVKVVRYGFSFAPADGIESVSGTCFTTGWQWQVGSTVTVRHLPGDPGLACPVGARLSESVSMAGLFVLVFVFVGLGFVFFVLRRRRWMDELLVRGSVGEAVVSSIESTNTEINEQRVYKVRLELATPAGSPPLFVRRHQRAFLDFAHDRLASKAPVYVLYDPRNPGRVLVPESL